MVNSVPEDEGAADISFFCFNIDMDPIQFLLFHGDLVVLFVGK